MGIISSSMRKKLPKEEFGIPAKRTYPMLDAAHAANAKARATQQVNTGKLSKAVAGKIDAKANKVLKRSKGK